MMRTGFPWNAQSQEPEKDLALSEENNDRAISRLEEIKQGEAPSSATRNHSSSQTPQPKRQNSAPGKHRNGSLKGSARGKLPAFNVPPDSGTSKATSPLPVRTIPPWVRDAEEDDLDDPQFHFPDAPHAAFVAQHNNSPSNVRRPLLSGQQPQDHGFTTASGQSRPERVSRWITFGRASAYPHENFDGEKVDPEYLDQNFTDYSKPWLADHDEDGLEDSSSRYRAFRRKRQVWYKRAQFTILRNPFIPLAFRLTVFAFALIALGLGASIYHETGRIVNCVNQDPRTRTAECVDFVGTEDQDYYRDPSGLMAIIVDAIALVYTIYITYDEYFSKPLGLRSARAKVRLILLDLFFIIFQSANLSLSFESLTVDEGACKVGDSPKTSNRFDNVCSRAEALSGVLLVSLTAWLMTFSVSVLRYVNPDRRSTSSTNCRQIGRKDRHQVKTTFQTREIDLPFVRPLMRHEYPYPPLHSEETASSG
ncbi:uncharacterized protein Z518_03708 [Rhinocladiella mackenziei CBS 650.93]|uniref:Regulator of phospholipase D SRF1 n=1 Tax=Rhinocladiella mackenziei CBS 650.93 TaxID=1442369 RepID=A0A0D2IRE9_9EURO|nr:uncharacterized protein Z518_03708 [Rhinocladiella mackenziei CBS 650.93]KIX05736.1 hypothetical protein Z518_03708 [Rhinocladiella mackenziei CBS 650.93]